MIHATKNIQIERAKPEDIYALKAVFVDAVEHIACNDYSPNQLNAWKAGVENESHWNSLITENSTWVAFDGHQLVGFVSLAGQNHIDMLYIHSTFGGKGIANLLLKQAEYEMIRLNKNIATGYISITAKPFFEKQGYIVKNKNVVKRNELELTNYFMQKSIINAFDLIQQNFESERLIIKIISSNDANFIHKLVNTDGWIKYIGNRNVHSDTDAKNYINMLLSTPLLRYFVVFTKNKLEPIGVVTFIQKDLLPYPDIGFAFLPEYTGLGFAVEAATALLNQIKITKSFKEIIAVCLPENLPSKAVLQKLGFTFFLTKNLNDGVKEIYQFTNE